MQNMHSTLRGRYRIHHYGADGLLRRIYEFDNLITNQGLDRIAAESNLFQFCHLSTNTAAPAVTDTAMGGTTVRTSNASPIFSNSCTVGGAPYYERVLILGYRFAAGVATGTWASIGLGYNNADSGITTKTLIRDGGGSPTTITVLAGEILDVSYELRCRTAVSQGSGTTSGVSWTSQAIGLTGAFPSSAIQLVTWAGISGVLYGTTGTIAHAAVTSGTPFTGTGVGTFSGGSVTGTPATYSNGNYYRDITFAWPTTATFSNNTVRGILLSYTANMLSAGWGILFPVGIGKTNLQTLTMSMRLSWGRA